MDFLFRHYNNLNSKSSDFSHTNYTCSELPKYWQPMLSQWYKARHHLGTFDCYEVRVLNLPRFQYLFRQTLTSFYCVTCFCWNIYQLIDPLDDYHFLMSVWRKSALLVLLLCTCCCVARAKSWAWLLECTTSDTINGAEISPSHTPCVELTSSSPARLPVLRWRENLLFVYLQRIQL